MQKTNNKDFFIWFKKMPIGNKITIMYGSIFASALILFTVFLILNAWYFYMDVSKQELDETVTKVEEYIKSGNEVNEETIKALNSNKYVDLRVINLENQHKIEIMAEPGEPLPPPPDTSEHRNGDKKNNKFEMGTVKGQRYMSQQKMVKYNDEAYLIQVFRPYYHEQKMMRLFAFSFIVFNVLGIFAAFLIGRFISKRLLKPVIDITQTAERISINDLSQRIEIPMADDEIKKLAVTFNEMINRLQISFDKQSRFISDASHELRTPISVIQGYANLIDRWGKSDPDILQESIESIKDETEHMTKLIKKLLFLAKDEDITKGIQKREINVNNLLQDIIKELSVLENSADINIVLKENVVITGDYDLIKQVFWIFIENAVKYSDKNKKDINIVLYTEDNKNIISIEDNGKGMKEEDLPYIFDRFYRGDKSRSKSIPGNGLGLSIAKLIINQHGGDVAVESEFGKGSKFILSFPK